MGALAWGLAALAGGVALLVVALLCLPLRLRLTGTTTPRPHLHVELRLFGGLAPALTAYDSEVGGHARTAANGRRTAAADARTVAGTAGPPRPDDPALTPGLRDGPARAPRRRRHGGAPAWLRRRWPALLRAGPRLLAELRACLRIEVLRIDAEFGLGDPADTGQLWGALTPLLYGLPPRPGAVALRPCFEDRAVLRGEAEAALRLVPAALLPPVLRFAWAVFAGSR